MAFVVGEVDLSPSSISRLSTQTKQLIPTSGTRYVLLDSVRDAAFLSSSSIANPDGSHDGGLGIVDNGIFVYTSAIDPTSSSSRQYRNKFFWIGSPQGTNDATDNFSIYVADVNAAGFYPGAPAAAWLVNPRLALHVSQAKTDIIDWFDSNYPGGASNGKGNGNSGSNSSYGTLAGSASIFGGQPSNPGDISGMNSLDGQFWPIYDYVDNTILLYFSVKTPNCNTMSIYCYKIKDTEFSSAAGSSQFLGGVFSNSWRGGSFGVTSSHRFSLISPDPLVAQGRVKGQQSAVGFYSFGTFDGKTPDHGRYLVGFLLSDVHGSPLNWSSPYQISPSGGLDSFGLYNVDKLGSIQAIPSGNNHVQASYALIYNATSDRDIRASSLGVVISAMQIRVAYYQPGTGALTFGSTPIIPQGQIDQIGHCRPQFTFLPDGLPKVLTAAFTFDQYLNIGYQYFTNDVLSPDRQRTLSQTYDYFTLPLNVPTYGKRKARFLLNMGSTEPSSFTPVNNASPDPQNMKTVAQIAESYSWSSSVQQGINMFNDAGTLLLHTQNSPYDYNGNLDFGKILDVRMENVDAPFLRLNPLGAGSGTYLYGVVQLED